MAVYAKRGADARRESNWPAKSHLGFRIRSARYWNLSLDQLGHLFSVEASRVRQENIAGRLYEAV